MLVSAAGPLLGVAATCVCAPIACMCGLHPFIASATKNVFVLSNILQLAPNDLLVRCNILSERDTAPTDGQLIYDMIKLIGMFRKKNTTIPWSTISIQEIKQSLSAQTI
jgi:hypothetical protein